MSTDTGKTRNDQEARRCTRPSPPENDKAMSYDGCDGRVAVSLLVLSFAAFVFSVVVAQAHRLQFTAIWLSSWSPLSSTQMTVAKSVVRKFKHLTSEEAMFPLYGSLQTFSQQQQYNPLEQRTCLCLLATPMSMPTLWKTIEKILQDEDNFGMFDAIHLTLTDQAIRFYPEQVYDPQTSTLISPTDSRQRLIMHRLWHHGALTQYMGPVSLEQHLDTILVFLNLENALDQASQIRQLTQASQSLDDKHNRAMWCFEGENFRWVDNKRNSKGDPLLSTKPVYMPPDQTWCEVDLCRGSPLLLRRRHFGNEFLWNHTSYACPDKEQYRWLSYQVERQGYPRKAVRDSTLPPGHITPARGFRPTCTQKWWNAHPEAYRNFREAEQQFPSIATSATKVV